MLRMTRNKAPLPCCGCTCSATRLLGRHPSRCSPPLCHNYVGVICTLAVRTACLASRVACVRAWSWLSHPRPPDRSQHGCTVGVDRGPTRVMLHPRMVVEHQSASSCRAGLCVVVRRTTVCGLCRQYVYWIISHTLEWLILCYTIGKVPYKGIIKKKKKDYEGLSLRDACLGKPRNFHLQ